MAFEAFSGTIDGKGHTISNLKINIDADMTDHRVYGFVNSLSGTIKNLTIKDAKYTVSTTNSSFVKDTRYTILGTFAGELLENGKIISNFLNYFPKTVNFSLPWDRSFEIKIKTK